MKKRILCTILTLLMLVTLSLALPTPAKADATLITAFTMTTSSNFRTPVAGEAIFFPSNLISISSTTPAGLASKLRIRCEWKDCTNNKTYDEVYIKDGVFCPGEWQMTVDVSVTDSNNYKVDYNNDYFNTHKDIVLGGKEFRMTGRSSYGVRYRTSFIVDGTGVAPVFLNDTCTAKGNVGDSYSAQLVATGDDPITYTKSSGTLPPGITLSSSGLLSGTFTAAGTYTFTVKASNDHGYAQQTWTFTVKNVTRIKNFTLAVTSNFTTPSVGEAISFPSDKIYISSTTPSGNISALKISCEWKDVTNGHTYDPIYAPTGTFTDGKWELTIAVSRVSDDYVLELDSWEPFTLGGKTFQMTGRSSSGARFRTSFDVGNPVEPIASAAVTITPPSIGAHPDYSPGLPANAPYYMGDYCDDMHVNDVLWFGGGETAANFVFREGNAYTVRIYLTPKDGYRFTTAATATLNGIAPDSCELYNDQLRIQYTFPVLTAEPEPIASAAVTITPPLIGAHPDYSPGLPANAPYYMGDYCDDMHVNDVLWFGGGETAAHFVFKAGNAYTVRIYLTPKDGYRFTTATTATLNGIAPDSCELYNDQLRIQYTFPALSNEFNGTVEFDPSDVQFRGTTPYVVYNGAYMTPRVIVKDAGGNVIDASKYDVAYLENKNAGTGYAVVTFKTQYSGTARGWFKIYLPPTSYTKVENVQDGIRVEWNAVPGAAGYVVYRRAWSTTTNGWTDFARWDNTTETHYLDGYDATHKTYAGTRYQYGVKAYFAQRVDPVSGATIGGNVGDNYNLGVVGPLKTTVRITTRVLNSVKGGSKRLTISWTPSKNFTGYEVQIATNSAFTKNVKTVKITEPLTSETTIKSLKASTRYYVRVRSYHEFEGFTYYGEWSNVLNAKTK